MNTWLPDTQYFFVAPLGKKWDKGTYLDRKSLSIGIVVDFGKSWQRNGEKNQIKNR